MSEYRLLQHKNFAASLLHLSPATRRKVTWAQVLLGARGRTPNVKGTQGRNARWRRTPVQGNHYYMWWIPQSESALPRGVAGSATDGATNGAAANDETRTILLHSVRHHDETDQPIAVGDPADYEPVAVAELEPRFSDQLQVSRSVQAANLTVTTLKGLPGSGKTVALLYLLKDLLKQPDQGKVVYVTYTSGLKRAAQNFIESHYPEGDALERLRIVTLGEILAEWTGVAAIVEPFRELSEFLRFLEHQRPADLGVWRRYPRTLFTEIRAHLLGRDFPDGYRWAQDNLGAARLDPESYAADRGLELAAAEAAFALAERTRHMRFFRDQLAARKGLTQLLAGHSPDLLRDVSTLVIDEVQDLTLLQIAFLTELLKAKGVGSEKRLHFVVAGDESQIVQPSGFDWGVTKFMLGDQLGQWPGEFNFEHQRRAPDNLAQLIDNSWNLYAHLPKNMRPSARRERLIINEDGDEGIEGRIYLCPIPDTLTAAELSLLQDLAVDGGYDLPALPQNATEQAAFVWQLLLHAMVEKPGRALIDLSAQLGGDAAVSAVDGADEVIFLPREIKGLERGAILLNGLENHYQRACHLAEDSGDGNIPRFEARRLFDEIRVALSRSTQNLILLDSADATFRQEFELDTLDGVAALSWVDLVEMLYNEEMTELEAVEGYLREVEELFERSKWEQAFARNRRALAIAQRIGDQAYAQQANTQYVEGLLQQSDALASADDLEGAQQRSLDAQSFAAALDDATLLQRVERHRQQLIARIEQVAWGLISRSTQSRTADEFEEAYVTAAAAARLIAYVTTPRLRNAIGDALADSAWQWAAHLADTEQDPDASARIAELLDSAAAILAQTGEPATVASLTLLAQRYREIPQRRDHSDEELKRILALAELYLDSVQPPAADAEVYAYVRRWLDESYADLGDRFTLYYGWSSVAERYARLAPDTVSAGRIVQLEKRLQEIFNRAGQMRQFWDDDTDLARFRALALGVHGEHGAASEAWEALGETEEAAYQARCAGEMERAFNLLRKAKHVVPEELATAVKFLRLLEQLEHKHATLTQAERDLLLARLASLRSSLALDEGSS